MLKGLIGLGCRNKAQPKGGVALCCAAVPRTSGSAFMPLRRAPRRPWAAWFVLLVALFSAMAPTVSHALVFAKVGSNGLVNGIEICSTQGSRVVALQGDSQADALADSSPRQESARTLDHCPFCLHVADHAAPPVQPQPYRLGRIATALLHTAYAAPVYVTHAYSRASPRGPPAHA